MENFNVVVKRSGLRVETVDGSWATEFGENSLPCQIIKYLVAENDQEAIDSILILMFSTTMLVSNPEFMQMYSDILEKFTYVEEGGEK